MTRSRTLFIGFALVVGSLVLSGPRASGATFVVDPNAADTTNSTCAEPCPLRHAILAANDEMANPGPDTITIAAGQVVLDEPGLDAQAFLGDLDITSDITIVGAGADLTGINQTVVDQVFEVPGTGKLTLRDLSVSGGRSSGALDFGAGVLVTNPTGELVAEDVVFTANDGPGAAIHSAGTTTVTDSSLHHNGDLSDATLLGGAIVNNGTMTITGSTITDNGAGSNGGAILNAAELTLIDSTVANNDSGGQGGGIDAQGTSDLTIIDSTISGNTSAKAAGGIYFIGAGRPLTISGSTISGNTVTGPNEYGGGLSATVGVASVIRDTTISGNAATGGGGGAFLLANGAPIALTHVTVTGNNADSDNDVIDTTDRGGGLRMAITNPGSITLTSSLIVGNADVGSPPSPVATNDCSISIGTPSSGGDNVFGEAANPNACAAGNMTDIHSAVDSGWLMPLANNGGPTLTHAITEASPAFDLQSSGGLGCPGADQRGIARPQFGACDAGAFEIAGDYQPDAAIRVAGVGALIGDGTYNATGAGQSVAAKTKSGKTVTFEVRVANDGDSVDTFDVTKVCGGAPRFSSALRDPGGTVLSVPHEVTLNPGATTDLRVTISSTKKAKKSFACLVTVTSQADPAKVDVVRASVTVKKRRR